MGIAVANRRHESSPISTTAENPWTGTWVKSGRTRPREASDFLSIATRRVTVPRDGHESFEEYACGGVYDAHFVSIRWTARSAPIWTASTCRPCRR